MFRHRAAIVASNVEAAGGREGKRYDFHATESRDVMYAVSEDGWQEALHGLPSAGSLRCCPGARPAISSNSTAEKCDGPARLNWFEWFIIMTRACYAFEVLALRRAAFGRSRAGARDFGGDAIIRADEPMIVDVNAWLVTRDIAIVRHR
jgi:hypothetical protein